MFIDRHYRKLRALSLVFFGIYIALMIYFLFFAEMLGRTDAERTYHYNLVLFREIKRFIVYRDILGTYAVVANLFGNVVAFVPFGFFVPILMNRKKHPVIVILYGAEISLAVEIIQLVTKTGSCDVDDLLLNTIGVAVGYLGYEIFRAFHQKSKRKYRYKKT